MTRSTAVTKPHTPHGGDSVIERKIIVTETQWKKIVDRLHKYKEIRMPDGDILLLCIDGAFSLMNGTDGHCIISTWNIDRIKRLYVE